MPLVELPEVVDTTEEAPPIAKQRTVSAPATPNLGTSELSREEQRLMQAIISETSSASTGVLTDARLGQEAKDKIRQAYAFANRRSHYAAQ